MEKRFQIKVGISVVSLDSMTVEVNIMRGDLELFMDMKNGKFESAIEEFLMLHNLSCNVMAADPNFMFNNKYVFIFSAMSRMHQDLHEKAKLIINRILDFFNEIEYSYTVNCEIYKSAEELLGALAKAVPPANMKGNGFWEYEVSLYE